MKYKFKDNAGNFFIIRAKNMQDAKKEALRKSFSKVVYFEGVL